MNADGDSPLDVRELREALEHASIPVLLPVLVQLTGDESWFGKDYRVERPVGFAEDPSGGLSAQAQRQVRDAALHAVVQWSRGERPAVPTPEGDTMARLMSASMGQRISADYAPMIAEQLGFAPFEPADVRTGLGEVDGGFEVAVIGAGVSGIVMARELRAAGVPFTVFEKNDEVGGTWWENRYPGARVDVPSNLYSFSFQHKAWSEHFGQRDEIADYLVGTSAELGIRDHIRFGHEVRGARWDEQRKQWVLTVTAGGREYRMTANALVTAVGLHNRPKTPDIPGLSSFAGEVVHSAAWPESFEVAGRRVGVVGSGASAMQVVPAIADDVRQLSIFQRSPHWIVPNDLYFQQIPRHVNWLLEHVPFYRQWNRFRLYWTYTEGMFPALVVDPDWDSSRNSVNSYSEAIRRFYTAYLHEQLDGRPDLVAKTLPTFPPFGRRILLDNGWFQALRRDDVDLVTDGIDRITEHGVRTVAGDEVVLDALVLCTGFQQQRFLYPLEVVGRDGRELREEWQDDDARAYLGLVSPGYPNLFYLFGPNTNPPGGSFINLAEAQARYVVSLITTMISERITSVDCRQERYDDYNAKLDAANSRMVFAQDGVHSYYRNSAGRVVTNSPWTVLQYWTMTRTPDLDDFRITRSRDQVGVS